MKLTARIKESIAEPARQTMGLSIIALLFAALALFIALGARHGG